MQVIRRDNVRAESEKEGTNQELRIHCWVSVGQDSMAIAMAFEFYFRCHHLRKTL